MERRLAMAVRDKFGASIVTRGDCEVLSDRILEATDELVSYNTLRRLFDLAKPVKPRRQTLNILAVYCGFKDYPAFCNSSAPLARWKVAQEMFVLLDQDRLEDVLEVLETASDHAERMDLLVQFSRELLLNGRLKAFVGLFDAPTFDVQKWEYSHQLHFASAVGLLCRKVELNENAVFRNSNFLQSVFLTFVDYASLNGFYGKWLDQISQMDLGLEVNTFCECLSRFRCLLNGEPVSEFNADGLIQSDLHPILLSRVFSVCWMCGDRDPAALWMTLHGESHVGVKVPLSWLHEMVTYALIVGDIELTEWILEELEVEKQSLAHFEHHHWHLLMLLKMALAIQRNEMDQAALFRSKVDIRQIRQGYRELIEVVWMRLCLAFPTDSGNTSRALIVKLKALGYPLLNADWVDGYFGSPEEKARNKEG
ncbi:MAG: hypothetical protein P8P45_06535 [Flavobacteriales bacterium]|nr:hypothetical protein [Flavobacteriales bacterium]